MYKMAVTCSLKDLVSLRTMSTENRRSAELWKKFQDSTSIVDASKFVLKSRSVEFATVIRSVSSNKIITYACGEKCAFITREPVPDSMSTFEDVCVSNAYTAYTRSFLSDDFSILMNSAMQSMGVVFYHGRPIVYLNVLVHDSVFDLIENQDSRVKLAEFCSSQNIADFKPIKGSFEELICDSFVVVGGSTNE